MNFYKGTDNFFINLDLVKRFLEKIMIGTFILLEMKKALL